MRRLAVVFGRSPRDERRAKPLAGGARAELVEAVHRSLLERAIAAARASGAAVRLVTTDGRGVDAAPGVEVRAQGRGGFAARFGRAVREAFADGYDAVVVVGGDAPGLRGEHVAAAFAALDDDARDGAAGATGAAVLGPARDGGFYLLGLDRPPGSALDSVPFQTRVTGRATRAALARAGFRVACLPPLADVDDSSGLRAVSRGLGLAARLARALLALLAPRASAITDPPARPSRPRALRPRGPPLRAASRPAVA